MFSKIRHYCVGILHTLPPEILYYVRVYFGRPRRYRNLIKTIHRHRYDSILEIGVYRGGRSKEMIETAQLFHPASAIRYYGFDLFEALDAQLLQSEFSKVPFPQRDVQTLLDATSAQVHLYQGFSQNTLPVFLQDWIAKGKPPIGLVFLDGGHAEETIASDWENVRQVMDMNTTVIFDDYYSVDYAPHIGRVGCQYLIDALDRTLYDVEILGPEDCFTKDWGTLCIKFAKVRLKRTSL